MVDLYQAGNPRIQIIKEYDLMPSVFDRWVRQYKQTGSFETKDNLIIDPKELIELHKRNKQLEMENDILQQVALIFGRRDK